MGMDPMRAGEPWGFGYAEEKKLELRLGPPGDDWSAVKEKRGSGHHHVEPGLSLGYYSEASKRGFLAKTEPKTEVLKQQQQQHPCAPPPPQLPPNASAAKITALPNNSSTRIAAASVVGWPPIRSFRKNIATSSKQSAESHKRVLESVAKADLGRKGLFVKINMDGIPIGRKVDLKAYDSYEKLAFAVDELFYGLLAAQRDHLDAETKKSTEEKYTITGLLDANSEYTLVYEDDEGDRMLVGDDPWEIFVTTVKRLRVLKSSELSALSLGSVSRKITAAEC